MVVRWSYSTDRGWRPNIKGHWVENKDYTALEQRVKELEAELLQRKEFYELAAKSYDANSKGWQADVIDMKQRVTEMEAELHKSSADWLERCKKFRKQDADEYEAELSTLRAERDRLKARLTEQADEFGRQIQSLHLDVAARDGDIVRLRDVLQKISVWGCSGHCVDLCGSKCPCCMAEEVLGGGE